ncbi:1-acyl-sn-glycerol-3-phosphate-acyltransferas-like protein [Myriangium duriaei CBS 260.36]|uniref:1-acyl-sn-glycerol-3-phosphate acyltransferase n=1 Tax=Myriangium duriaei CBS 260.36 TaxID=1168546 RepID=A0A9P4MFK6_9PEZI|nr:1-acyl-sn-glycerol-3-phosphate-acyltransferas-like protein [Myriangium duriaei CBS 260.36]
MAFLNVVVYVVSAIVALVPALHVLSIALSNPLFTFLARFITSVLCLVVASTYGVIASIVLRLAGYGGLSQWTVARCFKWVMWLFAGVTFSIHDPHGSLHTRPAVFVGNHQSELDVLMLGCMFPQYCSVTAKASLKFMPFLGWFMYLSKTVFINRSNNKEARVAFAGAVKTMQKDRQSVFLFPEGTRSYANEPRVLPFKKGAFHLAVQAQVPVVPIVVANYSGVLDVKKRVFNSGTIPISVLEAIPTKGLTADDVAELTLKVQKLVEQELIKVSQSAQKTGVAVNGKKATGLADAVKSQ